MPQPYLHMRCAPQESQLTYSSLTQSQPAVLDGFTIYSLANTRSLYSGPMSSQPASDDVAPPRRRPADRRALILRTAATEFSDRGYHAVRLEEIAELVGISTPALYRHFPTKYALFAETTALLAEALTDALDAADDDLESALTALAQSAIDHRRTGGLYRWDQRFLRGDDAATVRSVLVDQHRRIRAALLALRPDTPRPHADVVAAAMISVVASPTTHRTTLPDREIRRLLVATALSLADVPPTTVAGLPVSSAPSGLAPASKRELVLAESISLFAAKGFGEVTIDEIAAAAGIPASGVYRHFDGKSAILSAAFWRASDRVSAANSEALAAATTSRAALAELVDRYVRLFLRDNALQSLYLSEIGHLPPSERSALRRQQRANVDEWAAWVTRDRGDAISRAQARFLVHAALGVTSDLLRLPRSPSAEQVIDLCCAILIGPQRT